MKNIKIKHTATINKYKIKSFNLTFLGILLAMIIGVLMTEISNGFIRMFVIIFSWVIVISLIEKEVNNWLHKEAKLTITIK